MPQSSGVQLPRVLYGHHSAVLCQCGPAHGLGVPYDGCGCTRSIPRTVFRGLRGERETRVGVFTAWIHWVGWKACFDCLLRTQRLRGRPVRFVTGTDEHGEKIAESAKSADKSPKQHCDEIVQQYKELWKSLDIAYDRFVRTTDEDHEQVSLRCH